MSEHQDAIFIDYVVKQLVEKPEAVVINRTVDEMGVLIQLTVDPTDMGRVIGKEGRTAKALRTLLRVLGAKNNSRVNLKIMEPDGREVPMGENRDEHNEDRHVEQHDEQPVQAIEEEQNEHPVAPAPAPVEQPMADDQAMEIL